MFQAGMSPGTGAPKKERERDAYHSLIANCSRNKQQNEEKIQEETSNLRRNQFGSRVSLVPNILLFRGKRRCKGKRHKPQLLPPVPQPCPKKLVRGKWHWLGSQILNEDLE